MAIKFVDYTFIWWDQIMTSQRWNKERPVATLDDMDEGFDEKTFCV
jgi:hypothetical protein